MAILETTKANFSPQKQSMHYYQRGIGSKQLDALKAKERKAFGLCTKVICFIISFCQGLIFTVLNGIFRPARYHPMCKYAGHVIDARNCSIEGMTCLDCGTEIKLETKIRKISYSR